jgi:5-aminolevulinate synthase
MDEITLIEGTLGNAHGVVCGYITGSIAQCDFIRSFASRFIFTTALLPAVAAAAAALFKHCKQSRVERELQKRQVARLRDRLNAEGIPHVNNSSHIIPIMLKDLVKCKMLSDILMDQFGTYVPPINYAKGD